MILATAASVLDWFGIIVFALSGALVASRKEMDVVGFVLLGSATGIGGGTLRDILLGQLPVFWVQEPAYLGTCVAVSTLVFFTAHIPQSRLKLLLWCDAVGMALFAVAGAEKALASGASGVIAAAMGVVTASFGGVIRDILGGESPVILSHEIYATAALLGASTYVVLSSAGLPLEVATVTGLVAGFALRGAALHRGWSLPRYRARPGRPAEEVRKQREG